MTAKRKIPSPLTVLMIVVVIAAITTWLLPSGKYSTLTYANNSFTINKGGKEEFFPSQQSSLDSLGVRIKIESFEKFIGPLFDFLEE